MSAPAIDGGRLLGRIAELGAIGRDETGRLARLAATDADRAARQRLMAWFAEAGLETAVDAIGNLFGIWRPAGAAGAPTVLMMGSHIDTVINAGRLDGAYGVLGALEVIETLKAAGVSPARPLVVAAFTNEEGARYAPDMMGSLVYAGGLPLDAALASVGRDGTVLGAELARIGFAGPEVPGFLRPFAYVELHIEQGPVLEREGLRIGVVEDLQGISWRRITLTGTANHAGATPMNLRADAGAAAARIITAVRDHALAAGGGAVATVGSLKLSPDVINVIPARAELTVDLRDPDEARLAAAEAALDQALARIAAEEGVGVTAQSLARFAPVRFDEGLCGRIEAAATARGLSWRRMTSGAGHDAQMIARICPAAMIFVPSAGGVSHNPREHTEAADLLAGAQVLADVIAGLAGE